MRLLLPAGVNWDSFLPDVIVGVITGLVVGAALLLAEHFAQNRQVRAGSLFAWESLKPRLHGAAHTLWSQDLDGMTMPQPLTALARITSSEPIFLWNSHLKVPDPTLDTLIALLRLQDPLDSHARDLDVTLSNTSGQIALTNNINSDALDRVVRARAYRAPDEKALQTFDATQPEKDRLLRVADILITEPELASALSRYQDTSEAYALMLDLLKTYLKSDVRKIGHQDSRPNRKRRLLRRR